jgi:site-specific DNA recombinase
VRAKESDAITLTIVASAWTPTASAVSGFVINKQVRTDLLEAAVWEDVCSLLSEPERVEREYQRRLTNKKKSGRSQTADSLAASTKRVKRGIARLIDAYEDGLVDRGEFEPRIQRAKGRLAKLEAEVKAQAEKETEQEQLRLVIGRLQEFAEKVKDGLDRADWTTRREIIRALVKRVAIDEGSVRVVYRVNPPPSAGGPTGAIMQHCWRGAVAAVGECVSPSCTGRVVRARRAPMDEWGVLPGTLCGRRGFVLQAPAGRRTSHGGFAQAV